jgi:phospholipid transport system transporter-binding protein
MQLPQTLTLANARSALEALQASAKAEEGKTFVIDASTLEVFDTAALALLLQARRLLQSRGRDLRVNGAKPELRQLAQLYGVVDLLALGARD